MPASPDACLVTAAQRGANAKSAANPQQPHSKTPVSSRRIQTEDSLLTCDAAPCLTAQLQRLKVLEGALVLAPAGQRPIEGIVVDGEVLQLRECALTAPCCSTAK